MRKRFKYKEKGNAGNVPKTGGAELLLNNLIKLESSAEDASTVIPGPPEVLNRNVSSNNTAPEQKKRKRK